MNAQHLLGTTTQGIVNNYFLNGNEDILKATFERLSNLLIVVDQYWSIVYSFIVSLQQLNRETIKSVTITLTLCPSRVTGNYSHILISRNFVFSYTAAVVAKSNA